MKKITKPSQAGGSKPAKQKKVKPKKDVSRRGKPRFRVMDDGSLVVSGSDLVGMAQHGDTDVPGQLLYQLFVGFDRRSAQAANSGANTLDNLSQVGDENTLSWLAQIASCFQKVRYNKLGFKVESLTASLVSGGYFQSFLTDPLDANQQVGAQLSLAQAYSTLHDGHSIWKSDRVDVPVDRDSHYFVKGGDQSSVAAGSSLAPVQLTCAGVYQYVTSGPLSAGTTATNFITMDYEIVFMNPIISKRAVSDDFGDVMYIGLPASVADPTFNANESLTLIGIGTAAGSINLDPGVGNNGVLKVLGQTAATYQTHQTGSIASSGDAAKVPSYFDVATGTFTESVRLLVTMSSTALLPYWSTTTALVGPFKAQINPTSTYDDALAPRLKQVEWVPSTSFSTDRGGANSSVGNTATATTNNMACHTSGMFILEVQEGDRFNFWLNGKSTPNISEIGVQVPNGIYITLQKLGGVEQLMAKRLQKASLDVFDVYRLMFGDVRLSNDTCAGATFSASFYSQHWSFDDLQPQVIGWRSELRGLVAQANESGDSQPPVDFYNQLLVLVERSAESVVRRR